MQRPGPEPQRPHGHPRPELRGLVPPPDPMTATFWIASYIVLGGLFVFLVVCIVMMFR